MTGAAPAAAAAAVAAAAAAAAADAAVPEALSLEDLFKKTTAKPSVFWLPLSDGVVAEKRRAREQQAKRAAEGIGAGAGADGVDAKRQRRDADDGHVSEPSGPAVMEGLAPRHTDLGARRRG